MALCRAGCYAECLRLDKILFDECLDMLRATRSAKHLFSEDFVLPGTALVKLCLCRVSNILLLTNSLALGKVRVCQFRAWWSPIISTRRRE
jgi:hypothetical protein